MQSHTRPKRPLCLRTKFGRVRDVNVSCNLYKRYHESDVTVNVTIEHF